ncbi:ParA family protein [Alkalinema sp. FACHB-956]|uniref:ParA family protein n=1 Tax=Alkalinema sp. FACHB-956 TaxID=2692768 RepID=UPI001687B10E|nr:ParA family protein [Alkalinema sp. FACHB-956]MBD2328036.1 ParA family protein [Alkalinema sp. FACHB-956]
MAAAKSGKNQIRIMIGSNAGGSGKTTTSVHLAYGLGKRGYKVTIVELDYSGSLSSFTGLPMNPTEDQSIATVLHKSFKGNYPLQPVWSNKLSTVTAIQGGEAIRDCIREVPINARGHYTLQDRLLDYPLEADVVIFDTPASLEPMGVMALAASTHVLSPIKPEIKDAQGLFGFLRWYDTTIEELRLRPQPDILGFVPMRVDYMNSGTHRDVLGVDRKGQTQSNIDVATTLPGLLDSVGIHCFPPVKESKNYLRACVDGLPLPLYRPGLPAAQDFDPIIDRIIQLLKS